MFWGGSIFFCDSHTNYSLRSETSLKSMCRKSCHCLVFVFKNVALRSFVWKRTFFLRFQTELHVHMMRSLIAFFSPAQKRNGDCKRYHLWWKLAHLLEPAIWWRLVSCAAINWIQHRHTGEKYYWIAPYCIVFACVLTCHQTVFLPLRLCSRLLLFGTRGDTCILS